MAHGFSIMLTERLHLAAAVYGSLISETVQPRSFQWMKPKE